MESGRRVAHGKKIYKRNRTTHKLERKKYEDKRKRGREKKVEITEIRMTRV